MKTGSSVSPPIEGAAPIPLRDRFSAFVHRQLASAAILLGQREAATRHWVQVCALLPDRAAPLMTLAHLHAAAGRLDEAQALTRRAATIAPRDAATWFNLGYLQQQRGDQAAALESFDRALALDERLDRAWYGRALSLLRTGRIDEAIVALERNTALQPFGPYGWYQLAHAHARLGHLDKAGRIADRLEKFEPSVARQLRRELDAAADTAAPADSLTTTTDRP